MTENIDIKFFDINSLGVWPINYSNQEFSEAQIKLKQHLSRERNQKVVRMAKELFKIKHNGRLFCEVCEFDFVKTYGERGNDFIEAHHKKPISQMEPGDKTKVEDFVMVCPNCHRMLHTGENLLEYTELKEIVDRLKRTE